MADNIYVTPEIVAAANARIDAALDHEDRMALWRVALEQKSIVALRKPLVIDLDGPLHTSEQPICSEEACECAEWEFQAAQLEAASQLTKSRRCNRPLINANFEDRASDHAPLNGNRGFSILR